MSETPDLSTLPQRMRYAAKVMKEAAERESEMQGEHCRPVYGADHLAWLADQWETAAPSLSENWGRGGPW
jgi:hypothetical protein